VRGTSLAGCAVIAI